MQQPYTQNRAKGVLHIHTYRRQVGTTTAAGCGPDLHAHRSGPHRRDC